MATVENKSRMPDILADLEIPAGRIFLGPKRGYVQGKWTYGHPCFMCISYSLSTGPWVMMPMAAEDVTVMWVELQTTSQYFFGLWVFWLLAVFVLII